MTHPKNETFSAPPATVSSASALPAQGGPAGPGDVGLAPNDQPTAHSPPDADTPAASGHDGQARGLPSAWDDTGLSDKEPRESWSEPAKQAQLSLRTVSMASTVVVGGLLLIVTIAVLTAFIRIISLAEQAETVVVPKVIEQHEQAIMASELGRVAEMLLGSEDREQRAHALQEAESIALRFAQIAEIPMQSRLDSALNAVRRSAYRVDVLGSLEDSINGHLIRMDALLPPLGGDSTAVNSYATQLLFEVRHVLYEAATARSEDRLNLLRRRLQVLIAEMEPLAPDGEITHTGGQTFTLEQLETFKVILNLRSEYLKVRELVREETIGARRLLSELSNNLAANAATEASVSAQNIVRTGWNGVTISAISAAIALIALIGMIYVLVRHVVKPVLRTDDALRAIHSGKTMAPLRPALLREFDTLGQSVRQLAAALTRVKVNEGEAQRRGQELQHIFDTSPVPFILNNAETGEVIASNDAACKLFRVEKEDFRGRLMREYWVHPRRRDEMMKFVRREGSVSGFEAHMITATGAEFWAVVSARSVQLAGRRVILCAFVDITDQRSNERRLQDLVSELELTNGELEQFAYVASHDLKEPLRVVSGYLQLLDTRYGDKLDEEGQQFMGYARDAAQRMQDVIQDLLDYARVGQEAPPSSGLVSLQEVIDTARQGLSLQEQETGAQIEVQTSMPSLPGEKSELIRLFQNLIGNALKYHSPERPPLIEISATTVHGGYEFSIADNGIGIAPEHTDKIFDIFQRLHGAETYSGTGIGLAICRKIATQHGGRLWVDTASGAGGVADQGCTFHLFLPDAP